MFEINLSGKAPIYEQLYNGVAVLISTGRLAAGEKLPAVREVAKQLGINPNTVQKSYFLLEQAGLIYSIPAKGSYVADNADAAKALKTRALRKLEDSLNDAYNSGITLKETEDMVQRVWSRAV